MPQLIVRVSDEQMADLDARATESGISRSEAARYYIFGVHHAATMPAYLVYQQIERLEGRVSALETAIETARGW